MGSRGPISNTHIQIIEKTHPRNDLGVPILLYRPPQRGRPFPVTLYEDQWHEVLTAEDGTTQLYLGEPQPEIHQFDEEPPPPVYEDIVPAEERPKTPSSRHSSPKSEPSAESVTEPLDLDTQIRNSPFVEHAQLTPSPHHTPSHRDTLPSPLHQNQTAELSSQSIPIQSQSSLPITMSGTTTIASTTTTIPSGTGGGSLGNTQQAAQVATTAEQRIATAFATAFN